MSSSLERDLLYRMFKDNLEMADRLLAIGDFAMAAESLAQATEKIHQIASVCRRDATPKPAVLNDLDTTNN